MQKRVYPRTYKVFFLKKFICISVVVIGLASNAQEIQPGVLLNTYNKSGDTTTLGFYETVKNPSRDLFEPTMIHSRVSYNSAYPRGYNDGPVWKGKGMTAELHAGIRGTKGVFSYQLKPTVFFSQNDSYPLASNNTFQNPLNYQFARVDWVQRYGVANFFRFHPGQSEVRLQWKKKLVSISTQNYSFGPSVFNPILLSPQGGGFPHIRLGSEPFEVKKVGEFEFNLLAGLLAESDYFDSDGDNNQRYFNAYFIGFSPNFSRNLTLGFGKILYKQTRYFETADIFSLIKRSGDGIINGDTLSPNDTFDQMVSFTFDWNFPSEGFRAYAEFALNDFSNILNEPEHTRGYTIGFEKTVTVDADKELSITFEHTNLSINQAFLWRATPSYYVHNVNRQGYTHDGQLVGAGIGPGANSETLQFSLKSQKGYQVALLLQRIEANRDYFVKRIQDMQRHDQEYSLGLAFQKELEDFNLISEMTWSKSLNRYYESEVTNVYLMIGASFKL